MTKRGRQGEGGGRPPFTLSPEQKGQVEKLASILTKEQLADYFGMSRMTFTALMERDEEVCCAYNKGKAAAIGAVAQSLIQQARDGNISAAIFYLKTQAGWKETQAVELSGRDGKAIAFDAPTVDDAKRRLLALVASEGGEGVA